MLTFALIALVIAALGGLYMASRIFDGDAPPKAVAVIHGLAVVAGIGLLIVYVLNEVANNVTQWALILSLLTATGGIYLVSRHIRHKVHQRGIVVMHGLLAAVTIITLGIAVF